MDAQSAEVPPPDSMADMLVTIGRRIHAKRGQIILSEGSESADVLFVVSGAVQITLYSKRGHETILRRLSAGHMFGELSAIDGLPRSASVVAIEDSILSFVGAAQFNELMRNAPEASEYVLRLLTHRVRSLTERLQELATEPMAHRLVAELVRTGRPAEDGDGLLLEPMPTHVELAARIGSQREAVSRQLAHMRRAGLITGSGRRIAIPSVARLFAHVAIPHA